MSRRRPTAADAGTADAASSAPLPTTARRRSPPRVEPCKRLQGLAERAVAVQRSKRVRASSYLTYPLPLRVSWSHAARRSGRSAAVGAGFMPERSGSTPRGGIPPTRSGAPASAGGQARRRRGVGGQPEVLELDRAAGRSVGRRRCRHRSRSSGLRCARAQRLADELRTGSSRVCRPCPRTSSSSPSARGVQPVGIEGSLDDLHQQREVAGSRCPASPRARKGRARPGGERRGTGRQLRHRHGRARHG